uniref:Uncharacterized protein n=1 Tax=Culex tarsalis TaxID=7177 RepID=A0A1Q3EY17_CULTA
MDEFVVKTLQKWNLSDLVERFRDEEVNEEAFAFLTPDIIKELVPKLGKRAIFNARYAEFKQTLEREPSPPTPPPPTQSIQRENPPAVEQPLAPPALYPIPSAFASVEPKEQQCNAQSFESYFLQQLRPHSDNGHNETPSVPATPNESYGMNEADDEPGIKRIKLEIYEGEELSKSAQEEDGFDGQEESYAEDSLLSEDGTGSQEGAEKLRTLLGQSPLTRGLLELECLDKPQRIQLTNTVVQYLISNSKDGKVKTKTFRYWRDAILAVWPTQTMSDYFNRGNGRLNDRYQYITRARKDELSRLREQNWFASAIDSVNAIAAAASAGEGSSSAQRSEDSWDGQDSIDEGGGGGVGGAFESGPEVEEHTVTELRNIISNCFALKDTLKVQYLTPIQRNTLSSAIVDYLMDKNGGPITIEEMVMFAQAIERIYPNENASIYLRRACNRSRVNGKIFDRYSYVKRKNSIQRGKAWDDFLDERTTYGQLREIQNLEQARALWTETFKVRREMTRKFSPVKILDSFPFLKQQEGYKLLLEDFERELPDMRNTFQQHWPQTATSICRHVLETNFLVGISEFNVDDFQTDIVTSCLIVLPLLFKLSKRNEKKWNPSRLDVCHNFVLYAREFREAVDALKRRQQQLEHFKRRINPVVVAIGPTISTIEVTYIVIQDTFYRFESLPEAVELCLKIGAALGVKYLEEVSAPWYFVQRFVMKLELPSDFINTRVFSVVEALNLPMR